MHPTQQHGEVRRAGQGVARVRTSEVSFGRATFAVASLPFSVHTGMMAQVFVAGGCGSCFVRAPGLSGNESLCERGYEIGDGLAAQIILGGAGQVTIERWGQGCHSIDVR